jgi:hypothetical protein
MLIKFHVSCIYLTITGDFLADNFYCKDKYAFIGFATVETNIKIFSHQC